MAAKGFIFTVENPLTTEPVTIYLSVKRQAGETMFLLESLDGCYTTPRRFDEAVDESESKLDERVYNILPLSRDGALALARKIQKLYELLDAAEQRR